MFSEPHPRTPWPGIGAKGQFCGVHSFLIKFAFNKKTSEIFTFGDELLIKYPRGFHLQSILKWRKKVKGEKCLIQGGREKQLMNCRNLEKDLGVKNEVCTHLLCKFWFLTILKRLLQLMKLLSMSADMHYHNSMPDRNNMFSNDENIGSLRVFPQ